MKRILFLLGLSALPLSAISQTVPENMAPPLIMNEPNGLPFPLAATTFYRANTVYLITTDSLATAYKKVGQLIAAQGFTIANANRDFYTISTAPRSHTGGFNQTITAAGSRYGGLTVFMLTGGYTSAANEIIVRGAGSTSLPMEQRDNPKNTAATGFDNLVTIAKTYPGAKIGYRRR